MNMSTAKTGYLWLSTSLPYGQDKQRLQVVAYLGMSDPFVVFYNDNSTVCRKPCAVLRLSHNFRVQEHNDLNFEVTPLGERIGNGPSCLVFTAESAEEKQEWISIFKHTRKQTDRLLNRRERRKPSRCTPKMAAIEETDESWEQRKGKRSLILA